VKQSRSRPDPEAHPRQYQPLEAAAPSPRTAACSAEVQAAGRSANRAVARNVANGRVWTFPDEPKERGCDWINRQKTAACGEMPARSFPREANPSESSFCPLHRFGDVRDWCSSFRMRFEPEPRIQRIAPSLRPLPGSQTPTGCDRESSGRTLGCSGPLPTLRVCMDHRDRTATPEGVSRQHP
jgi:hypothetical protein